MLKTKTSYGLCIMPQSGDPDYQIWVAQSGAKDILTGNTISFTRSIGPMFYPTNDTTQQSSNSYAVKFDMTAAFANITPRFHGDFYNYNEENIIVNNISSPVPFRTDELCFMSDTVMNLARLDINLASNSAFVNGEIVYQSNGSANVFTAYAYSTNTHTLLLTNTAGTPTNTYQVQGATSSATANVANVSANVTCSNTSNTITLPFTANLFYANQSVFLTSNDGSTSELFIVTAVGNSTLQLFANPTYTDGNCWFGTVRGDGLQLSMKWRGYNGIKFNNFVSTFYNSTANTLINPNFHFGNSYNTYIFGADSRTYCSAFGTIDLAYDMVIPHFSFNNNKETKWNIYWGGYEYSNTWVSALPNSYRYGTPSQRYKYWSNGTWTTTKGFDSNYVKLQSLADDDDTTTNDPAYGGNWAFANEKENDYYDYPRIWRSRSNEWLTANGARSELIRVRSVIANSYVVPNVEKYLSYATMETNLLFKDEDTSGFMMSYANSTDYMPSGTRVCQQVGANTVYGYVYRMDPSFIYVHNVVSNNQTKFVSNASIFTLANSAVNAFIISSVEINEKYGANVFPGQSRYISKVAAPLKYWASDLQIYMDVYRPAKTNFKVYTRVKAAPDLDLYTDKLWSRLIESRATTSTFSSSSNTADFIEVQYVFPSSNLVFNTWDQCVCSTGSNILTVPTTNNFPIGSFLYLNNNNYKVNVRQVMATPNNNAIILSSPPSFSNGTGVNVGIIPGLEDQRAGFLVDFWDYKLMYFTANDVYFDTFNQYAVKIVPISDSPVIVPKVNDYRAIAIEVDG
jgi:hypothetical protein